MFRVKVIYRLPPPVFLIRCQWKLIALLRFSFILLVEMPIPLGFGVVVILILFKFVKLVHFLETIVVFAVDGHVVGDVFFLGDVLELYF